MEDSFTNWYLIEDDGRLTVVDAGVPSSWTSLHAVLPRVGLSAGDIDATVLTHAHLDHVGFAERVRRECSVPVYVHEADVPLTRHPWRYDHERSRAFYMATQVRALPIVATFARHRAFWPTPLREVVRFEDGVLPVPGEPPVRPHSGAYARPLCAAPAVARRGHCGGRRRHTRSLHGSDGAEDRGRGGHG